VQGCSVGFVFAAVPEWRWRSRAYAGHGRAWLLLSTSKSDSNAAGSCVTVCARKVQTVTSGNLQRSPPQGRGGLIVKDRDRPWTCSTRVGVSGPRRISVKKKFARVRHNTLIGCRCFRKEARASRVAVVATRSQRHVGMPPPTPAVIPIDYPNVLQTSLSEARSSPTGRSSST